MTAGIVYQIDCKDCGKAYIGETGKTLEEKLNQHQAAIRNKNSQYQTYQPCRDENHQLKFDNPKILDRNNKDRSRWILESFYSRKHGNVINRFRNISEVYTPTAMQSLS